MPGLGPIGVLACDLWRKLVDARAKPWHDGGEGACALDGDFERRRGWASCLVHRASQLNLTPSEADRLLAPYQRRGAVAARFSRKPPRLSESRGFATVMVGIPAAADGSVANFERSRSHLPSPAAKAPARPQTYWRAGGTAVPRVTFPWQVTTAAAAPTAGGL